MRAGAIFNWCKGLGIISLIAGSLAVGFTAAAASALVTVSQPAYCSDVSGNVTVSFSAPGYTTATVKCWKQDATTGHDSTWPTITLAGGNGSFIFPTSQFPHGPITIRIRVGVTMAESDICYLQLYNTGGVSWNQGIPAAVPPPATDMVEYFRDDFTSMPAITSQGTGASYAAHHGYKDFSGPIRFADPTGTGNPFSQRESYLRIRGTSIPTATGNNGTTGDIETGPGILGQSTQYGYFECRFIAPNAPGSWPAFWGCTGPSGQSGVDELDVIEAYGSNSIASNETFSNAWHIWGPDSVNYSDGKTTFKAGNGTWINLTTLGKPGWATTFHLYGVKITSTVTTFYCDNVPVWENPTTPYCKKAPFYPIVNLAFHGDSVTDLTRYNNIVDMYVDYWRFFRLVEDAKFPDITPGPGMYADSVRVTMQAGAGVAIRYTLDGSTPTASSLLYSAPVTIKNTATVKCIGILSGASSKVDSARFTIIRSVAKPAYAGLKYKYYEYNPPAWDSLSKHPLSALTPLKTGVVDSFHLNIPNRRATCFAVHFEGAIKIDTATNYTFFPYSAAGSRLYIDGQLIVNNDGRHAITVLKSGTVPLNKGYYPISLDYFADSATPNVIVYYQKGSNTASKVKIPKTALFCSDNSSTTQIGQTTRNVMNDLQVSYTQSKAVSIAVNASGPYEMRIARADGRIVKTISGDKSMVYTMARREIKPGVYIVTVSSNNAPRLTRTVFVP